MDRVGKSVLLSILSLFLAGCAFLLGAGMAVGTYHIVQGDLARLYGVDYDRAWEAALLTLEEMEMTVVDKTKGERSGKIVAKRFDESPVRITVTQKAPDVTQLRVRIGPVGDRGEAEGFHDQFRKSVLSQPAPVGARLDSDEDGVPDDLDQCPETPEGATVNSVGCWAFEGVVLFDFGRYDIKPEAYPLLNEVVTILKMNPETKVEIEGHTDNVGTAEYNQRLSEERAKVIMDYLVENGIDAERLSQKGYGVTQAVASNDTEEGRAKNRRVKLRRQ